MIYSVWRPELRRYDYYEAHPRMKDLDPPHPRLGAGSSRLGLAADEAAWTLPGKVTLVGSGVLPRGMIATQRGLLSSLNGVVDVLTDSTVLEAVSFAAIGYLLYRIVFK